MDHQYFALDQETLREQFTFEEAIGIYGEPCNNCARWEDGCICSEGHRQKVVCITTGHIPELAFRKRGGCEDHELKEGDWWHEDPIKPFSGVYGGTKTNILV